MDGDGRPTAQPLDCAAPPRPLRYPVRLRLAHPVPSLSMLRTTPRPATVALLTLIAACSRGDPSAAPTRAPAAPVATIQGLSGPESVRYDPEQDVYLVGNWNGPSGAADNNGFISRVRPDGMVDQLKFISGGAAGVTLHAPRGMTIVGDTLWAADVGAVRGFNRRTGAPVATIDFSTLDPGFLNDITPGPDGALYVTDTPRNRIYRISGRTATVALEDSALSRPNGITWDGKSDHLIVIPFGGKRTLHAWRPGERTFREVATGPATRYDGIEFLANGAMVASAQSDSTLVWFSNGVGSSWAKVAGAPADIALDTRRRRIAVPFVALNRVDIWQLP